MNSAATSILRRVPVFHSRWCYPLWFGAFMALGTQAIFGQTSVLAPASIPRPSASAASTAIAPAPVGVAMVVEDTAKAPRPTSMFFSPEEQQRIREALIAYEKSKLIKASDAENKAHDFLNQLTDALPTPKKELVKIEKLFIYPQFFLQSLVYHTYDDWQVIINQQRFSPGANATAELRILSVDNEKVQVEWKPVDMQKVKDSWAANYNEQVAVDAKFNTVTFTLMPNQTFSSYVMRVLEGKVKSMGIKVIVDSTAEDTVAASARNAKADAQAEAAKAANKKNESLDTGDIKDDSGTKGLNKTYKRMGLEN